MEDTSSSVTIAARTSPDHFLNPASLSSMIDDIFLEVEGISRVITQLYFNDTLSPTQIDPYRAEFLDLIALLRLPIFSMTVMYLRRLASFTSNKENWQGDGIRNITIKTLPRTLLLKTKECQEFRNLGSRVAENWQRRTTQIISEMDKSHQASAQRSTVARMWHRGLQQLWPSTNGSEITTDAIDTISALLSGLEGMLKHLTDNVERIEIYWKKRADAMVRHHGPLDLTWQEMEYFTPAWIQVSKQWASVEFRTFGVMSELSRLGHWMSLLERNATWLPTDNVEKEYSWSYRTRLRTRLRQDPLAPPFNRHQPL